MHVVFSPITSSNTFTRATTGSSISFPLNGKELAPLLCLEILLLKQWPERCATDGRRPHESLQKGGVEPGRVHRPGSQTNLRSAALHAVRPGLLYALRQDRLASVG